MFLNAFKRVLIYTLAWAILIISFYFAVWRPNVREIERLERKISINRRSLNMIRKQIEGAPEISEGKLASAEKSLDLFLARIPAEVDLPDVLRSLRKLGARRHRLRINSISSVRTDEMEEKGRYSKALYRLIAEGDFRGMVEFIRDLESSERLISIESLSIKAGELDLTFAVFYSPLKAEVRPNGKAR